MDLCSVFLPSKYLVKDFEIAFSQRSRVENAIAFKYGRTGLFFLLSALNLKNKKVILPAYTCVVVAHAIIRSGNIPVFVDCPEDNPIVNGTKFLEAIDQDTGMVILTHLFGMAMETEDLINKIRLRNENVFILQDCAHSFFAKDSKGNEVQTLGDGALFGLNISKLVNSVKGGMLLVKNSQLAEKIRAERQSKCYNDSTLFSRVYVVLAFFAFTYIGYKFTYFLIKNTKFLSSQTEYYDEDTSELPKDFLARMNDFEATIGIASLKRYEQRIEKRRAVARTYVEYFKFEGLAGFLPSREWNEGDTWSHFPILVNSENRSMLIGNLEKEFSVQLGIIVDYSVNNLSFYKKFPFPCPNSVEFAKGVMNLNLGFYESRWNYTSSRRKSLARFFATFLPYLKNRLLSAKERASKNVIKR